MATFDISNIVSWQAACEEWNVNQDATYNVFRLTDPTTLSVNTLNGLVDNSNNFGEFTATFDGAGNTFTLDGTGTTDINNSLFMDLSDGTIQDFTFDISGCTTVTYFNGFLVGKTVFTVNDYGTFIDINVNNLGSTIPTFGGYMVGGYLGYQMSASQTTTITNCNFTGDIDGGGQQGGGLFGYRLFYNASGSLIISNCDISGNIGPEKAGGLAGDNCCGVCQPSATIDITNCTFTGTVSSSKGGGLFGFALFGYGAEGNINITDCDISGNITGGCPGGLAGQLSFYNNTVDASINITNCNFTGVVSGPDAGGLFGGHCFQSSAGDIIIQDCDISATVGSAGGLGGDNNFLAAASTMSADISNCTFTGDITGANGGGLFGRTFFISGDGNLTFQNCDISANITGSSAGGLLGSEAFKSSASTSTIDICNNTISVNLQGRESGGLFGPQFLFDSEATLNIENNTITVTGIDVSNAGISVYESGTFTNEDCTLSITNNTIQTTTAVPASDFGGIFYVNSGILLDTTAGLGTLTITGNDLSGITFTSNPPSSVNYLFNEDGISFFDDTVGPDKIFLSRTLNPNTYGPILFDISNITTWQAACEEWNVNQYSSSIFRLISDTSLNVLTLNALEDGSNNFDTFTATFDGCGNTLTLDGTGSTDISNSLFMDLNGGLIQGFVFDISGCTTTDASLGFLVGISGEGNYGNFLDISVNNLGSTIPDKGGHMVGRSFGYKTANDINITNCNFYGDIVSVSIDDVGGLFGAYLFEEASGNIVIENCDISGHIAAHAAGGIMGRYFGRLCTADASINITNCNFTGDVGHSVIAECGGLLGGGAFYQGAGDMVIENCDISGNIIGDQCGGIGGQICCYQSKASANITISNCDFTGDVEGENAGGLFGAYLFRESSGNLIIQNSEIVGNVIGWYSGGIGGSPSFPKCQQSAIITISNCNFTGNVGDVSTRFAGGLFGGGNAVDDGLFRESSGNLIIQNCDISGIVSGQLYCGGIAGHNAFKSCTTDASINITNCNFTGDVSGSQAGGFFGFEVFEEGAGNITIQDCDIIGNITGQAAGGIAGQKAFVSCTTDASINITNCNFTGDVVGDNAGGLFGEDLFYFGDGDITIQNCDISGIVSGLRAGGIGGYTAFYGAITTSSINITNCSFIGDVSGQETGGLFGSELFQIGNGEITIQDCDISGTINGTQSGGLGGYRAFFQAKSTSTIDICNNTIILNLQGRESGGLFGSQLLDSCGLTPILNIKNNTITITGIDVSNAGISVYEGSFDNNACTLSITNNTIQTTTAVPSSDFGGMFFVSSGTSLDHPTGNGTLTITGNDLSGIDLTSTDPGPFPDNSNNYLFNDDGMAFFDGFASPEIFSTLTINNNTLGPFTTVFDISNITTWQAACEKWNLQGVPSTTITTYRLTDDTSLNVLTLNTLADGSNNFDTFTATFDGCGNTLTMDGSGSTDISNSLFMDLSGGTIQDFRFDISGCISVDPSQGFLVGISGGSTGDYYGNLRDISVHTIGSVTCPTFGGYMVGQSFGSKTSNTIEISNCNFTGDINATNAGGLFGAYLFDEASGNIVIQNSEIVGNISGNNSGGIAGSPSFPTCGQSAIITISNCNFTGDITNNYAGGLFGGGFGTADGLFRTGAGNITIQNCDISGIVSGYSAGGIAGHNAFKSCTTDASINITNCNFTGDVSGTDAGGFFGFEVFEDGAGYITIQDCDIIGNITGLDAGGITGEGAFGDCTTDASINITNCNFTGNVEGPNAGGLFGNKLFDSGAGDITIQDCDISGSVSAVGGGGIAGQWAFYTCTTDASINITNCSFIGDVSEQKAGGMFGRYLFQQGAGDITIQNCDISGTINGTESGGIAGQYPFALAKLTSTIDICNNTITLNLQGAESGGLFGSQLLYNTQTTTLNITNNTITITGIDVSNAGISVYYGAEGSFDNNSCTLSITNNTIQTTTAVPASDFGGIFFVSSGTSLDHPTGNGTLTITGNDLSGITFTNLISPQGYLFNEDGISFFDGSAPEIFATLTLNPNTYGPILFDISNITTWQEACEHWSTSQYSSSIFRLTDDTSLNVLTLNALEDGSNNFDTFTATFDGCGNTLTLDGTGSIDISNSLFMDLSGGTIQDFRFDISDCIQTDPSLGFLVGILGGSTGDYYGNLRDISVNTIGSVTCPADGGYMVGQSFGSKTSNTIEISNCNFTGDINANSAGGLFGSYFFKDGAGTLLIQNCDICGNITSTQAGGIAGSYAARTCTSDASINIMNCNFTGDVTNTKAGGLFGYRLLYQGAGDINIPNCNFTGDVTNTQAGGLFGADLCYEFGGNLIIQNCDIIGNITGNTAGGIGGGDPTFGAFVGCTPDASINITNCNFTGDVTNTQAGGLFGNNFFQAGSGDITIQDCDIIGNITGDEAGGIAGEKAFRDVQPASSINITNCNFTGDVSGDTAGGLFGNNLFYKGLTNITIQNCDISGTINGTQSGGIAGRRGFLQAGISAPVTIDICNNTITLNLQGAESGGLFGSELMEYVSNATLNITNNTITITGIDVSNAGISVYESGSFSNKDCSVNIINNTIRTTTSVASADFGGVFYVHSGTAPANTDGCGNLTITGNDLSGINLTSTDPGPFPDNSNNYLFNDDGMAFFDGSAPEIFSTLTINNNTLGPFTTVFDISNITTWQAACEKWNLQGVPSTTITTYRLSDDTSLNVVALNLLGDGSNNFNTFTLTFDGCGNRLTLDGTGSTDMSNSLFMDLSGGTIRNFTFDISGCTQTNSQLGYLVGRDAIFPYGNFYDININNLDSSIPILGGFMGGTSFGFPLSAAPLNINISNCNFIGNVTQTSGGGLFGDSFCSTCNPGSVINITNCDITGDVIGDYAGGLFGSNLLSFGEGDITIQNCSVNGNITGQAAGGLAGGDVFYQSMSSANININSNTIDVDLQGTDSGALFGSQLMESSQATLNIDANVITITSAVAQTAGVSVYESGPLPQFDNDGCTINMRTNTIQTLLDVSPTDFGGIFYVNNSIDLTNSGGSGTLLIENNNFSGISFATEPSSTDFYLFNDDGVPFFDDSINDKIFLSRTIINNTFPSPPPSLPTPIDFSTYDFMLQWIYKNSLTALEEQTWFESYALYLRREQVMR